MVLVYILLYMHVEEIIAAILTVIFILTMYQKLISVNFAMKLKM